MDEQDMTPQERRYQWLKMIYALGGMDYTREAFELAQQQESMCRKYGNDNL